jgi:adenylate cyclase
VVGEEIDGGGAIFVPMTTNVFVEALLERGTDDDIREAQSAIDRCAAVDVEAGMVLYDIWLLRMRARLAQVQGADGTYRNCRDRYRKLAKELGFEGHMAVAEAMP